MTPVPKPTKPAKSRIERRAPVAKRAAPKKAEVCDCSHKLSHHYGEPWGHTSCKRCACLAFKVRPAAPKRAKRPRRQRNGSLAAAKRTLWSYFAKYIKARDGNRCFTCDAYAEGDSLHAGHMFAGRSGALLFDPLVVFSQCAGCNRGRRGNAAEFAKRYLDRFGVAQFRAAVERTSRHKHWTEPEIRELIEALKRSPADYETLYMEKHGL